MAYRLKHCIFALLAALCLPFFCAGSTFATISLNLSSKCHRLAKLFFDRPYPLGPMVEGSSEKALRALGFRESYIRGLDQVEGHLRLAQKLRSGDVDPWKGHIKEFAELVKPHLDYVEKGIRDQNSLDKQERLAILEDFRREALAWVQNRTVTYRKFVNLNYRLSILATLLEQRGSDYLLDNTSGFRARLYLSGDWMTNDRLEAFYLMEKEKKKVRTPRKFIFENYEDFEAYGKLDQFPEVIIMPQMDGLWGKMPITRLVGQRVYLHALVNNAFQADGKLRPPEWIFWHDGAHMTFREEWVGDWIRNGIYETMIASFHNAFILEMERIRPRMEREMLELTYYTLIQELPIYFDVKDLNKVGILSVEELRLYRKEMLHSDSEPKQFPLGVENSPQAIENFVKKSMDIFDQVAKKVYDRLTGMF